MQANQTRFFGFAVPVVTVRPPEQTGRLRVQENRRAKAAQKAARRYRPPRIKKS
ncbi:MAG: hypothetical protein PHO20_02350 [Candidatus Peribacteraceae bacterium]|nr:hypothetical protein [Candidatus Peribacteraceae bacterium]MDD5739584.1 hypothetical protein [Candidatus Peribacteraceae bacterium]